MKTAINMIMMIQYCTDKNIETAAIYFTHALSNSAKGFTATTNPFFASLNRLTGNKVLPCARTPPSLLVDNQPADTLLTPILTSRQVGNTDIEICFPTALTLDLNITQRPELSISLLPSVLP